jgi:hypothetical protein
MCEVCGILEEYEKAGRDLSFRISQHSHALIMGNRDEAATAQTAAVNALYSIMSIQARMVAMAEKLGKKDGLAEFLQGKKGDKKPPFTH